MSTDYFDRLDKCIAGWKQVNASERYLKADERLKEFYSDTLIFLKELRVVRAVLDLDPSAHILDEEAERRAIEEAQFLLERDKE